jgi:hypothetical protein
MGAAAGGRARPEQGRANGAPHADGQPEAGARSGDIAAEARFLQAWEQRLLPFPTNAGYITRVRQIRRAFGGRLGVSEFARAMPVNS